MKELIVIAHKKEAQCFIKNLRLKKEAHLPQFIYSNEKTVLLVCGQGIKNAKERLSLFLSLNNDKISKIFNLGIAGRLNSSINLDEVYPIKCVGLYNDGVHMINYSLDRSSKSKKCITSIAPISNLNLAQTLSSAADIVEMELWAIVEVAMRFSIPVNAYKLISDDARFPVFLEEIKNKAPQFSGQLFEYYKTNLPIRVRT